MSEIKRCEPFEHELTYVTDREQTVTCKKCFIEWNVEDGVRFKSKHMKFDELYKLRKKYR